MSVLNSLPPKPITLSALNKLEEHDAIKGASPMMITGGSGGDPGDDLVFNFILKTEGGHHALVLDEDGDGWKELDSDGSFEDATAAMQAWQQENGLSFGGDLE